MASPGRGVRLPPARPRQPAVTLSVYAHLSARGEHAQAAREALEASYRMAGLMTRGARLGRPSTSSQLTLYAVAQITNAWAVHVWTSP
jgi:hypothetical protein